MWILMALGVLMSCASWASESPWAGDSNSVSVVQGGRLPGLAVTATEGVLHVTGRSVGDSVSYLCVQLKVKPFTIGDRALSFGVKSARPVDTAGFYVRGLTANGRRVLSYQLWDGLTTDYQKFVLVPGRSDLMKWEPQELTAPLEETITRLWIYIGVRGDGHQMDLSLRDLRLVKAPQGKLIRETNGSLVSSKGFEILGIGVKSAELRSLIAVRDSAGRRMLLCRPQDHGPRGYLLLTDVDSGQTTQYFNPPTVRQGDNFGSLYTHDGKFMYDQAGGHVLCFDLKTRQTAYLGQPDPGRVNHFMVYTEAPDGTVYLGGYPHASVTAYNPQTGTFRNYGPMDPREKYVNQIAADRNGTVYCGLGTARANIVALDPVTGKITQVIPEDRRGLGSATVVAGDDGYVYARFRTYQAKLLDGKVVALTGMTCKPRPLVAPKYGGRYMTFDDGSRVIGYDLFRRVIELREADGRIRKLTFDYESGGLEFTSLGLGPQGKVYGSTCHPMNLVEVDPATVTIRNLGPNPIVSGGNFCNFTTDGKKVYACEYAGGRLWEYDPALPIHFNVKGVQSFGYSPAELAGMASSANGHCSILSSPRVLFCKGYQDGAVFTFKLKAETTGRQFLNCQFLEHEGYGVVHAECLGQSFQRDLQRMDDNLAPIQHLGPFDLKAGQTVALNITVKSNGKGSSHSWFGVAGMSLTKQKLTEAKTRAEGRDNPRILGRWKDLTTRPRAINVHPDGRHVVISGFANYGLTGGGFGIHDLQTGKNREISDWLPGQSCICFRFLPNGDIIGGTSNDAPGGGYQKAQHAALFRLDWNTGKVLVSKEIPGCRHVLSVELWQGFLWVALPDGRLLQCDPDDLQVIKVQNLRGWGGVPRNALQKTPDGRLFILQARGISEILPRTFTVEPRVLSTASITSGGAVSGDHLYFACWNKLARFKFK